MNCTDSSAPMATMQTPLIVVEDADPDVFADTPVRCVVSGYDKCSIFCYCCAIADMNTLCIISVAPGEVYASVTLSQPLSDLKPCGWHNV